jgi:hypothetical protein
MQRGGLEVRRVDNLSTGFCPWLPSWVPSKEKSDQRITSFGPKILEYLKVRSVSDRTLQQWHEAIAGTSDPVERIKRVAVGMPEHFRKMEDQYHVLHGALGTSRDKKVLAVMREHYKQIEDFFAQLITDGKKSGTFRKDLDPRAGAWQLIYSGIGFAMINLNLGAMDRTQTEAVIDSILRGMKC